MTDKRRMGEILVELGLIDEHRLRHALEISKRDGMKLGETIIRLAYLGEASLANDGPDNTPILKDPCLPSFCTISSIIWVMVESVSFSIPFIAETSMQSLLRNGSSLEKFSLKVCEGIAMTAIFLSSAAELRSWQTDKFGGKKTPGRYFLF